MIKAIIFDFAGVIGTNGFWTWLEKNVQNIESQKEYFLAISNDVDKGIIEEKAFVSFVSEKTGRIKEEIWPEVYEKIKINDELLVFTQLLRKKYKIGLLSNFVYEWLHELLTKHDLHPYFDEVIISAKEKLIKPEPEIFLKILSLLKIQPDEAIFVDDKKINVDAANRIGLKGILYTDIKKFKKDLIHNGITTIN